MHIVDPGIERYIAQTEAQPHPVLRKMEEYAEKTGFPIVGPQVGRLLSIFARSIGAERILELGSGYGYSALWFALALPQHGRLVCTELSDENRQRAMQYFEEAGLDAKLSYRIGDGVSTARELTETEPEGYDIVFNDVDKEDYPQVPELAAALLRPGGLFITDNTLWYGRVIDQKPDSVTQGIRDFNERTVHHPQFETSILPIRDGLTVAVRR
jgi:predicted O-methyltransferase YrrM